MSQPYPHISFDDWIDMQDIEYQLSATINGVKVGSYFDGKFIPTKLRAGSYEDLADELPGLLSAINDELTYQYDQAAEASNND